MHGETAGFFFLGVGSEDEEKDCYHINRYMTYNNLCKISGIIIEMKLSKLLPPPPLGLQKKYGNHHSTRTNRSMVQ